MPNPSPEDSPDVPDSPVVQRDSNGYAWLHSMQSSVSPATTPSSSRAASPLMFNTYEATLAEKIRARIESKDKFFSLEFFPPRTKAGAVNLMSRLDRMRSGNPLYIGKTLQTHTNGLTRIFNEINFLQNFPRSGVPPSPVWLALRKLNHALSSLFLEEFSAF